eukprot:5664546-Pleurochrysis_carterae.AAC.1
MASSSARQHRSGMRARRARSPAASASRCTASSSAGWLNRSASTFASLGTETASHWCVSLLACASSARICAAPLDA